MKRLLLLMFINTTVHAETWTYVTSDVSQEALFARWVDAVLTDDNPIDGICGLYTPNVESPYGAMIAPMPENRYPWSDCERHLQHLEKTWSKKQKADRKNANRLMCRTYPPHGEVVERYQTYVDLTNANTGRAMRRFFSELPESVVQLFWERNKVRPEPVSEYDLPEDLYGFLDQFCAEVNA